jgi:hypothetical protein
MQGFFHMSFFDMGQPLKMVPEVKGEKLNVMRHIIGFLEGSIQSGRADTFPRLNKLDSVNGLSLTNKVGPLFLYPGAVIVLNP